MVIVVGDEIVQESLPLAGAVEYLVITTENCYVQLRAEAGGETITDIYIPFELKSRIAEKFKGKKWLSKVRYYGENELYPMLKGEQPAPKQEQEQYMNMGDFLSKKPTGVTKAPVVTGGEGAKARIVQENNQRGTVQQVQNQPNPQISTSTATPYTPPPIDQPPPPAEQERTQKEEDILAGMVDASAELPSEFLVIPEKQLTVDNLQLKLEAKEGQIKQLKFSIQEGIQTLRQVEQSNMAKEEQYQQAMTQASNVFEQLKTKYTELNNMCGKFYRLYGEHPLTVLQEGFSQEELPRIKGAGLEGRLEVIFCCGEPVDMLTFVSKTVEAGQKAIFVDITGDYYLTSMYKCKNGSLKLFQESIETAEIKEAVTQVSEVEILTCRPYHDILLLFARWDSFMENLSKVFPQGKIYLLFGAINSFAVEYTVAKFTTLYPCNLLVKCVPAILNNAYVKLQTIPANRGIRWLVRDTYESMQGVLESIGKTYKVVPQWEQFDVEGITWRK